MDKLVSCLRKARGSSHTAGCKNTLSLRISVSGCVSNSSLRAGKVCARHWYDKSKHIFPASRWEVYDADKDHNSYTVK